MICWNFYTASEFRGSEVSLWKIFVPVLIQFAADCRLPSFTQWWSSYIRYCNSDPQSIHSWDLANNPSTHRYILLHQHNVESIFLQIWLNFNFFQPLKKLKTQSNIMEQNISKPRKSFFSSIDYHRMRVSFCLCLYCRPDDDMNKKLFHVLADISAGNHKEFHVFRFFIQFSFSIFMKICEWNSTVLTELNRKMSQFVFPHAPHRLEMCWNVP